MSPSAPVGKWDRESALVTLACHPQCTVVMQGPSRSWFGRFLLTLPVHNREWVVGRVLYPGPAVRGTRALGLS